MPKSAHWLGVACHPMSGNTKMGPGDELHKRQHTNKNTETPRHRKQEASTTSNTEHPTANISKQRTTPNNNLSHKHNQQHTVLPLCHCLERGNSSKGCQRINPGTRSITQRANHWGWPARLLGAPPTNRPGRERLWRCLPKKPSTDIHQKQGF